MNHTVYSLFLLAVLFAVLFVKKHDSVIGIIIAFTAAVIIISESLTGFENIIVRLNNFTLNGEIFEIPLKALGITLISKILISACDDAGEKLLSFTASLITKTSIILITLPIVEQILGLLGDISSGN
ncbi:MAG: hypothetical protein E7564_02665 [Ruminococcaceae bacterium]|nr:hypothetical protein [Oscillospiraceae bacterium]